MSRERFVDVTAATISPEPRHGVEFGSCGSGDLRRQDPYPLQLELLRTDRRTYRRMERVAVDVRIKNISTNPVLFPSSPTPIARRDRPPSRYRHAGFDFVLLDPTREKFATDLFVLYGAPAIARSLIPLEPGESVTLRLPAMLSGNGYQDARNPILYPAPGLRIATEMWLFAPGDERFRCRFGHSVNSLPIAIGPTIAAVPDPPDDGRPPVVREIAPSPASSNGVVRVAGYRLGADHSDDVDVIFSNGSLPLKATIGNSSYESNNRSNGLQELFVTVPGDALVGQWNVTIRRRGVSSAPFPVMIEERQQTDRRLQDVSPSSEIVLAPSAEAWSTAASIIDVVRVGPSDQIVVLHDGPDRPASFNIVEGDPLVFHFENPTTGEIVVTLRARRRSIHLRSARQDEYNVAVRLPETLAPGPWDIEVQNKATNERYRLPMTMVVHERPR
jgi:hypothetical protein